MVKANETKHCGHCGNKATFEVRAKGNKYGIDPNIVGRTDTPDGIEFTTWRVLECRFCRKPTLEQTITDYGKRIDPIEGPRLQTLSADKTILYPTAKTTIPLTNLPESVENKYIAALNMQNIEPSACAVLAGRTLEAVCNHESAQGRDLSAKLNYLATSGRIPPVLAEMAHQLRQIRNLGAHDADDEVTEADVPIILDFLEAILEYLYVAPAKIAAVQARLNKTP